MAIRASFRTLHDYNVVDGGRVPGLTGRRWDVGWAWPWLPAGRACGFSTRQINEETETCCIPEVVRTIDNMAVSGLCQSRLATIDLTGGRPVVRWWQYHVDAHLSGRCAGDGFGKALMAVCAKFPQPLDLRYTSQISMSPTIFRQGSYRFFFNSREETRMHVHVMTPEGTAKFWLEPLVALADYYMLNEKELRRLEEIVRERHHDFISAWRAHFKE